MSGIDIFIIVVLGAAAIMGFVRGMLSQVGQIAGLVVGVLACRVFGSTVIDLVGGNGEASAVVSLVAYGIIFVATYVAVWLLARLLRLAVHAVKLGIFDRLAGAVFKMFLWSIMLSLALNVVLLISGDDEMFNSRKHPYRAMVLNIAPKVLGYIADGVKQ